MWTSGTTGGGDARQARGAGDEGGGGTDAGEETGWLLRIIYELMGGKGCGMLVDSLTVQARRVSSSSSSRPCRHTRTQTESIQTIAFDA